MFGKKHTKSGVAHRSALGAVLGGALLSTSTLGLAAPAMADADTKEASAALVSSAATAANSGIEIPGAGEIWDRVSPIYDTISRCVENEDYGLPCLQSDGETLAEIHGMVKQIQEKLDKFLKQYAKDRQRTMDSFDVVVKNQANAEVRAQWQRVQADLETSHISMKMYQNFMECVQSAATTSETNPKPTCKKIDINGVEAGTQDADMTNIFKARQQFLDKQHRNGDGFGGYQLAPTDFMQSMAGTTIDPYASESLMHALLERELVTERAREGLPVGHKLTLYPASLVNGVGDLQTSVVLLEGNYFSSRMLAAQLNGDQELADSFQRLADKGRDDSSPVLSLPQQLTSFRFPDWTPENRLSEQQAYVVGPNSGAVKITNRGMTNTSPDTATDLPTMEEVRNLAADFGASGSSYGEHAKRNDKILPIAAEQQGRGNPTAAGQMWTKPQELIRASYQGVNNSSDRQTFQAHGTQALEKSVITPIYLLKAPGASYVRKDGVAPVIQTRSVPMSIYNAPSGATKPGTLETIRETVVYPGSGNDWANPVWNLHDEIQWKYKQMSGPTSQKKWFSTYRSEYPHGGGASVMGNGVSRPKPSGLVTITPVTAGGALPGA